jgi:hypothetical protein
LLCSWRISSRKPKAWNVFWSIKLTNNGTSPTSVTAQVLFIDQDGFALEDCTAEIPAIPPSKSVVHRSTAVMSPDLAQSIKHALAKVSAVRK